MNYQRTKEDLKKELLEQIGFIKSSCVAFDQGNLSEAKRLSVPLRVLLVDNGRNMHSLLKQLDIKNVLQYHTLVKVQELDINRVKFHLALPTILDQNGVYAHKPNLSKTIEKLSFEDWWNQLLIINDEATLSRGEIIRSVSDGDGGAHIDPLLKGGYASLAKVNGTGWTVDQGKMEQGKPELFFLRQFTEEILRTFDEQLGDLIGGYKTDWVNYKPQSLDELYTYAHIENHLLAANRLFLIAKDYHKAIKHLEKALEIEPENILVLQHLGIAHREINNTENDRLALKYFEIANQLLSGGDASILYDIGRLHIFIDNNLREAAKYFESALLLDPNKAMINADLALVFRNLGEPNRALPFIEKALQLAPDNPALLYRYGGIAYDLKQYNLALEYIQRAVEMDIKNAKYHFELARVLKLHFGQQESAKEHYLLACDLDSSYRKSENDSLFNV